MEEGRYDGQIAESKNDGQTGGVTTRKFIDITVSDPQIGNNDLTKQTYDKSTELTEIQKKWFNALTKPTQDTDTQVWKELLANLRTTAGSADGAIVLKTLDSNINWDKWLGTPIKNPIQQFDK